MTGIDIASLAKQAAGLAFDLAGTAKTTATLNIGATGTYDPASDTTTLGDGSAVTVEGVLYKGKQTQGSADAINRSLFVIKGEDVPSGIDEADTAVIDGVVYQIEEVEAVPTKAIFILHLRK